MIPLRHNLLLVVHPQDCAALCHLALEKRLQVLYSATSMLIHGTSIQSVRGHLVHGVLRWTAQGAIKAVDAEARQVPITARAWRISLVPPTVEPLAFHSKEGRLFTGHAFRFWGISAWSWDLSKLAILRFKETIRSTEQSCSRPEQMLRVIPRAISSSLDHGSGYLAAIALEFARCGSSLSEVRVRGRDQQFVLLLVKHSLRLLGERVLRRIILLFECFGEQDSRLDFLAQGYLALLALRKFKKFDTTTVFHLPGSLGSGQDLRLGFLCYSLGATLGPRCKTCHSNYRST